MSVKNISNIIQSMSIEQKVGQLFMLAFPNKNSNIPNEMIKKYVIGRGTSVKKMPKHLRKHENSTHALQKTAYSQIPYLPLILGVGQEGSWEVLIPQSVIGTWKFSIGCF